MTTRRDALQASGAALALAAMGGAASAARGPIRKVVVIGAGFGGATAAKYLRQLSDNIDVVLVERSVEFVSCPMSNLVIGGVKTITDIKTSFFWVSSKYGIGIANDEAVAIDLEKRQVRLARSSTLEYDRLIVAPGVDFVWEEMPGMSETDTRVPHAWKAGRQTTALRKQLEDMKDGGLFVISIPPAPYRCPPGPYERACVVAAYLRQSKPRSKVLILDANADVVAKGTAFRTAWTELYPGMIEYLPNAKVIGVEAATLTARTAAQSVKADVLNVIPPMRAGRIAQPLLAADGRWCDVDFVTYESRVAPNVHVLGDSLATTAMPRSGHVANAQAKVCVAALIAQATGKEVNSAPVVTDACFSFVSTTSAALGKDEFRYDSASGTMVRASGSEPVVSEASDANGRQALTWARNLWNDMLK